MTKLIAVLIATLSINLVGCGGSGSAGSGPGRVAVFVTDSFLIDYDHVWTTIYSIDLLDQLGNTTNLFADDNGMTIDVRSLYDSGGAAFAFLGMADVPGQTFSSIRVTLAPTMTLIPGGTTTGTSLALADSVIRDSHGHAQITFPLPSPRQFGGTLQEAVDFDLTDFSISLGKIVPSLKEGSIGNINVFSRHSPQSYTGTISGLAGTSPNTTFTLTTSSGHAFDVETVGAAGELAPTAFYNSDGSPSPAIANGKSAAVRGTFDVMTNRLIATDVRILPSTIAADTEVEGTPLVLNESANTFSLKLKRVSNFQPLQTTVIVSIPSNAIFLGATGVSLASTGFFTRLGVAGATVTVLGAYNAATNTLTARLAKLEVVGSEALEARVKGTAVHPNPTTWSFDVNPVAEYEGYMYGTGPVHIATSGSAVFYSKTGETIDASTFFATFSQANPLPVTVEVYGAYYSTSITAAAVALK